MLQISFLDNTFSNLTAQWGGAVNCDNPAAYMIFNHNQVTGCSAKIGAGIYKVGQCTIAKPLLISSNLQKGNQWRLFNHPHPQ